MGFVLSGAIGGIWVIVWLLYYRDPEKGRLVGEAR